MSTNFMTKKQMLCSIENFGKGIVSLIDEKRQDAGYLFDLTQKFPDQQNFRLGDNIRLQITVLTKALDSNIQKVINYPSFHEMYFILHDDRVLKDCCKGTLERMNEIIDLFPSIVSSVNRDLADFFKIVQPRVPILNAKDTSTNYWQTVKILKSEINRCMSVFFNHTAIAIKNVDELVKFSQQQFLKDITSLMKYNANKNINYIKSIDEITNLREQVVSSAQQLSDAGKRIDNNLMNRVHNNLNALKNQLNKIFSESENALGKLKSQFDDPEYFECLANSMYDENPTWKDGKMKTENWANQITNNKYLDKYKKAITECIDYLINATTGRNINPQVLQNSLNIVSQHFSKCGISISANKVKDPLEKMLDDLERGWAGTAKIRVKK